MKKYPENIPVSKAIYDNLSENNPLLAAMPELLSYEEFIKAIACLPKLPYNLKQMSSEERRRELALLTSVFVPMDYMYVIYDQLYRAIRETYMLRTAIEEARQINAIFCNHQNIPFTVQTVSGSILGLPGIGKTSTICRSLAIMPQVIEHTKYKGRPFFCKQVLYLKVECPSDCSVKTLAYNLITALDQAIGVDYVHTLESLRRTSSSAIATKVKVLCMTHHVGLLLVDEIQNAVTTAQKSGQIRPLLKFLVELTNDTSTAVFFVGTPVAEEMFVSQEHLKRRTRGIRLLPLKPDGTYRRFLEQLWVYQLTPAIAPLSDQLANKLFDASGGIPAYIVKIFQESQVQAILLGREQIGVSMVQKAIDILTIHVPKTYSKGTYLSDFQIGDGNLCLSPGFSRLPDNIKITDDSAGSIEIVNSGGELISECDKKLEESQECTNSAEFIESAESAKPIKFVEESAGRAEDSTPVSRLYANQRGRKADARDRHDLIVALQSGCDMVRFLQKNNLIKEWVIKC